MLSPKFVYLEIVWVVTSRRTGWADQVARMGKKKNVQRILEGKPEGRNSLGKSTSQDVTLTNLKQKKKKKKKIECADWISLAQAGCCGPSNETAYATKSG